MISITKPTHGISHNYLTSSIILPVIDAIDIRLSPCVKILKQVITKLKNNHNPTLQEKSPLLAKIAPLKAKYRPKIALIKRVSLIKLKRPRKR